MTDHIPKDVIYAAKRMSNYNRNRFRLETVSSDTSGPNKIVTVNMPENATLDMKSFKFHFDAQTDEQVESGATVRGRLPADASSLIQRIEVYINGIQVMGSLSEYGTAARMLKIARSNRDRDGSIDRSLSHGAVTDANTVEDVSIVMRDWIGFLGESAPRYLNTDMLGQIQVRITFAPASVLIAKENSVAIDNTDLSNLNARTAAGRLSYTISNMFFTVDSVQIDEMYTQMLRERLSTEDFIPINYKEYYNFSLDNITGARHSTRFSLSVTSLDRIYATFRNSNFQTTGVKGFLMGGSSFSENLCSNALHFKSFNNSNSKEGSFKYQFKVNNVSYPQYKAGVLDALFDLAHTTDKVHSSTPGFMPTSLQQYNDGMFVLPLTLCHPGEDLHSQTGYNSKGINTQLVLEVEGQVPPTADPDAQTTDSISSYVLCETTAQLRVGLGRNIGVAF